MTTMEDAGTAPGAVHALALALVLRRDPAGTGSGLGAGHVIAMPMPRAMDAEAAGAVVVLAREVPEGVLDLRQPWGSESLPIFVARELFVHPVWRGLAAKLDALTGKRLIEPPHLPGSVPDLRRQRGGLASLAYDPDASDEGGLSVGLVEFALQLWMLRRRLDLLRALDAGLIVASGAQDGQAPAPVPSHAWLSVEEIDWLGGLARWRNTTLHQITVATASAAVTAPAADAPKPKPSRPPRVRSDGPKPLGRPLREARMRKLARILFWIRSYPDNKSTIDGGRVSVNPAFGDRLAKMIGEPDLSNDTIKDNINLLQLPEAAFKNQIPRESDVIRCAAINCAHIFPKYSIDHGHVLGVEIFCVDIVVPKVKDIWSKHYRFGGPRVEVPGDEAIRSEVCAIIGERAPSSWPTFPDYGIGLIYLPKFSPAVGQAEPQASGGKAD
ncbi:hypothetical protein [Falsiroseomonas tokyonensis]|uniref:Uncharacterized protein n=1 Tax=Falsiroseomonas tokyonensis TaxID=430521 RepID=A0ABV7BX13_9PROT|nr:hypothetical protein [Falsiroseomonas tokyonensis]MBU8538725.1 hypothetical protein [Falsiroseomonas tokyonensis]